MTSATITATATTAIARAYQAQTHEELHRALDELDLSTVRRPSAEAEIQGRIVRYQMLTEALAAGDIKVFHHDGRDGSTTLFFSTPIRGHFARGSLTATADGKLIRAAFDIGRGTDLHWQEFDAAADADIIGELFAKVYAAVSTTA